MNTLGNIFRVTSFGESHGEAVGCVLDGCPAGLKVDLLQVQAAVDKRKTAQLNFTSQRKESDTVQILSGLFEGITIGSPICILIKNEDAHSYDYSNLKDVFRPGHADYTNQLKYGLRDYRGGGRTSIRITAPMVAAGEIARQLITHYSKVHTQAFVSQIGEQVLDISTVVANGCKDAQGLFLSESKLNTLDASFETKALSEIERTASQGDTLGGRITCIIDHLEAGIGEPIFGKLQAALSHALMSINTVKAIEFGEGIAAAKMTGATHNDAFIEKEGVVTTSTNRHGGILGGISSGNRIYFSVYFKPISSIKQKQKSLNAAGHAVDIEIKGRHDVCAVPRAVPIVEAYVQIVLADLLLQNRHAKI